MRAGSKEGGGGDRGRVAGAAPVAARRPPSLCMSRSLWRSAAEDSASGSTRCLGLTRPLAEWVSSSVARAVAAAVEAAGAARLPLPSAHSARPGVVVVPAVAAAVARIAAAKAAAAVASQNAVCRQRATHLHHNSATR